MFHVDIPVDLPKLRFFLGLTCFLLLNKDSLASKKHFLSIKNQHLMAKDLWNLFVDSNLEKKIVIIKRDRHVYLLNYWNLIVR